MRIERKYLAHFIAVNEKYERLGTDLEEFSPELSASIEKFTNILGENRVSVTGYEKTVSVEPYYAEKGSALFNHLQGIIDENMTMDQLKTDVVEVKLWEVPDGDDYPAVREQVYIEVTSYGGDHNGCRIGFKLHYTGVKRAGLFNVHDNTFMELGT